MQILPPRNAAARNKLRKVLLHGVCALLFCHAEKLVMLPPVRDEAGKTDRIGQNAARLPIEKDGKKRGSPLKRSAATHLYQKERSGSILNLRSVRR